VSLLSGPPVPLLPEPEAHAAAQDAGVPPYMAGLNVFRVLLHHPRLAGAVHGLLSTLLFDARLDARLRELVIMRVGWLTGSEYEWTQHWRVARSLGVDEDDLLAVRQGRTHPRWGPTERAVLAATDDALVHGRLGPDSWDACRRQLGGDPQVLLELVTAIATWRMIAVLLSSLEVPLEPGVASWPPDGLAPDDGLPPAEP
jgi:alkylhydroperoxidase family enzyme